jgi:hypothetical protein
MVRSVGILLVVKALQGNKKLSEFGFQFLYRPPFSIIIIFLRIPDPAVHGRNRAVHQNFWHKTYFLLKLKTHSLPGQKNGNFSGRKEQWSRKAGGSLFFVSETDLERSYRLPAIKIPTRNRK